MFGQLFKSYFLDADLEPWVLDTFAWLMTQFGGIGQLKQRPLVLPTKDFYPPTSAVGEERGDYIFARTCHWIGANPRSIELVPFDRPQAFQRVAEIATIETGGGRRINGIFEDHGDMAVIRYARDLTDRPPALIATLAHELCHFHLSRKPEDWPGGREVEELVTELAVAYFGFGVFAANNAFAHSQYTDTYGQGWMSSVEGYLSERSWCFALAVFLTLSDRQGAASLHLKHGPAAMVKKAEAYLAKRPALLAPLRAIP